MFDRIVDPVTRDLNELLHSGPIGWVILAALVLLPVLATALIVAGSRLAVWPLLIYVAVWLELFAYYGLDYRSNQGAAPEALIRAAPMLVAWVLLGVAAVGLVRRRRAG
jgi:hypothetical protein